MADVQTRLPPTNFFDIFTTQDHDVSRSELVSGTNFFKNRTFGYLARFFLNLGIKNTTFRYLARVFFTSGY